MKSGDLNFTTLLAHFLKKDRKRAEKAVQKAFDGYTIRKIRSDAGKKKLRDRIYTDEAFED